MGRRTTRGRGRRQAQEGGPSRFFLIALAIGLILLVVMAVIAIRRPAVKHGQLPSASIARLA